MRKRPRKQVDYQGRWVSFVAPLELKAAIEAKAEAEGRTLSNYLRRLCEAAVREPQKTSAA